MTRSICSTCQASIPADAPHCPRCGPGALKLIVSDEAEALGVVPDPDVAGRLARALGRDYEVVRPVGRGGFAEVYEVRDTTLQRRLAVKVLRGDLVWTAGTLGRFKQEARAIARLSHPHTVPIHFVSEGEGLVFYAMPFIEGETLGTLLRREGALPAARALGIAVPVLDALAHAHRHGIVHRDLKPDNVMLEARTGRPLLVDFGIAKWVDEGAHHTSPGYVVGTPMYMSPEQALGQHDVDARSDIYSFGAVLYQMLTGEPPFDGTTSQEIVGKHLADPVPSLVGRGVPVRLAEVVMRCLAKRPADRYPSADAVLAALRGEGETATGMRTGAGAASHEVLEAPTEPFQPISPLPTPAAERRARGRRRAIAVAAAMGLVATAGIGGLMAVRPGPTVTLENLLAEPVMVAVNGAPARRVGPGDTLQAVLARGAPLRAAWHVVRPVSLGGRALGEELRGTIADSAPRADLRLPIASASEERYFAPVLSNRTGLTLTARLEPAPTPALRCDCAIPAGADGVRLGYYRLRPGMAIVLTDSAGRRVRFERLDVATAAEDGTVRLVVEPEMFDRPPVTGGRSPAGSTGVARPARPERPAAAELDTVLPAPDSLAPQSADSAGRRRPPGPADDPLRRIFPQR